MTRRIPRVLVDTCTREHGILIGRAVAERCSSTWGDLPVSWDVVRPQARKHEPTALWLREQIPHLPAIAAAMRPGQIEACTSGELRFEGPHKIGFSGMRGDLWRDVTFAHVDPPLERSTWMGALTMKEAFSGDHQQEFCERLLHYAREGVPQVLLDVLELDDFQRANLPRLGEYRVLCEAVGPERYRDAFHLWTALCHRLEYFLTTDETFLRVVRKECIHLELHVPVVSPAELVDALHLPPAPLPLREGEVIPYPLD